MKKLIFTLLFVQIAVLGFSQSTYYWVGGPTGAWNTAASWNEALDGSLNPRTTPATNDILIFDGSNISGASPSTGQVTPVIVGGATIGQLKLQNAADLVLQRSSSASSGTATFIIAGDGTAANDFTEDATSKLKITCPIAAYGFVLQLGVAGTPATAAVSGTISILDGGLSTNRFITPNTNCINFLSGSVVYSKMTVASAYPFGGSGNTPPAASLGVNFKAGSTLVYQGGNSIWGTTSTFNPIVFEAGSNMVFEAANVPSMFGSRSYANVIVRPLATAPATPITVAIDGNHFAMDTLTIDPLATFNLRATGTCPIAGDIVNNGTFGAPSATTSNLIMYGSVPQSIRGAGTFNSLGAFSVGTNANVTLQRSLTLAGTATSSVTGRLNFGTNTIATTNSGGFQFRAPVTTSYTATTVSGTNDVTAVSNIAGVVLGLIVTGPGIQAGSYIISTSGSTYTLSKPTNASGTGVTLTTTANAPTFETSNAGGADASLTSVSGTRNYSAATNYFFNAATTTPFSDVSNANASSSAGNVTFNAAATTNRNMSVNGALTLNTGKVTIRPTDTLRVTVSGSIGGTFNNSQYFVSAVSGANTGVLRVDSFTTAKFFPIGTPNYYMPVTLTPTTVSTFCTSAFEGVTNEGTPNGTPFTILQKDGIVDAVWILNRTTANTTDLCNVDVAWQAAQEGPVFPLYFNAIGIARHDGVSWLPATGGGDNTLNTASSSFTSFSPFSVGQRNIPLPVKLTNFAAKTEQGKVKLQWTTEQEINVASYTIERSADGRTFNTVATITATGARNYMATDNTPLPLNFYRLKIVDKDGKFEYSTIIKVKLDESKAQLTVYPNPVKDRMMNVQLNNYTAGKVSLKLFTADGRLVFTESIQYNGGNQAQSIKLPANIVKGIYRLVAETTGGQVKQSIMID